MNEVTGSMWFGMVCVGLGVASAVYLAGLLASALASRREDESGVMAMGFDESVRDGVRLCPRCGRMPVMEADVPERSAGMGCGSGHDWLGVQCDDLGLGAGWLRGQPNEMSGLLVALWNMRVEYECGRGGFAERAEYPAVSWVAR
jgi:ribosomal protein S27AE